MLAQHLLAVGKIQPLASYWLYRCYCWHITPAKAKRKLLFGTSIQVRLGRIIQRCCINISSCINARANGFKN